MADQEHYQAALELALNGDYREAQEKLSGLLQEQPRHVQALILLGKVEYYLRRFEASRERFEQALSLEPENPAAFFGLQYYTQRGRTFRLLGLMGFSLLVLILLATFFFFSMRTTLQSGFIRMEGRFSGQLFELEGRVAEEAVARERNDNAILLNLEELAETLTRYQDEIKKIQSVTDSGFTAINGRIETHSDRQMSLYRELQADIRALEEMVRKLLSYNQDAGEP